MFIPLGLFLRLRHFPLITFLIVIACSYIYIFHNNFNKELKSLEKKFLKGTYYELRMDLFQEFCETQGIDKHLCLPKKKRKKLSTKSKAKKDISKDLKKIDFMAEINKGQKLIEITQEFNQMTNNKIPSDSELRDLISFKDFNKEHEKLLRIRKQTYKRHNLLTQDNITPMSILYAMFSHGGIMHLVGNMFGLIVFGIYVESRMGKLEYGLSYLLGGFFGLGVYAITLSSSNHFVVGASANVFAVMGLFYIFFRDKPMKFFMFYLVAKVVKIPVRKYFFFLFILLEVILVFSTNTNVAHSAHVVGLVIGILYAFYWNKRNKLPPDFLYKSELKWFADIKKNQKLGSKVLLAQNLLSYNPYNHYVRRHVLNSLLEESLIEPDVLKKFQNFMERELSYYLLDIHKDKGIEKSYKLLRTLPNNFNITRLLEYFYEKDLISILDLSLKQKHYFLSLRVIATICHKYKRSKQIKNHLKTATSILENTNYNESQLKSLIIKNNSMDFKQLILKYIERGKYGEDF